VLPGQFGGGEKHLIPVSWHNQTQVVLIFEEMDQETGSLREKALHLSILGGFGKI
jgi:hypothetical protein